MSMTLRRLFARLQAPEGDEGASLGGGGDPGTGGGEPSFDMVGAVDSISADLFGGDDAPPDEGPLAGDSDPGPAGAKAADDPAGTTKPEDADAPTVRAAPQSWKKEMHEKFATLPADVQEYIEQREGQMRDGLEKDRGDANLGRTMRDIMTPYRPMLQAQGVDEPRAVQFLLNAHYKLSNGDAAAKAAYFGTLAQQYGVDLSTVQPDGQQQVDPAIKALQDELNGVKAHLTAGQQAAFNEAKTRVSRDVEAFAADASHTYFDEVSNEIIAFLHQGLDLKDAYDRAVWANPVTRAKETARLQEEAAQAARTKAEQEVSAAKAASSNTVRNRDTRRTPTEPKGSMKDMEGSLRETLREIKARTH
ncbi:MAG: hypothetical protein A3E01_00235 [Gammaproteobacteria bacterium RIFCSPHIGHO2_12_FULL_63_22]|nr:MAG: hypothetical protein A3E01_00235 [Gammaproteobacteria bacterium RIFCSPHIGHO2_12_FULL_63_22]